MNSKMSFAQYIFRGLSLTALAASVALAANSKSEKKAPGDFYEELSRLNKVLSEVNLIYYLLKLSYLLSCMSQSLLRNKCFILEYTQLR